MDLVELAIIVAVVVGIYFLPTWISSGRKHPRADTIFWVNMLLGWLIIGWLVALVWSLSEINAADRSAMAPQKQCPECAEMVLKEANICKHCLHDFRLSALKKSSVKLTTETDAPTQKKQPITKEEALALARKYGIRRDGDLFDYKGEKFSKISTALQFAHERESKNSRSPL